VYQEYYNDSYYIYKIVRFILNFLKIEILISLDDSRYSNELNIASKDLGIKTIGYMHGRFNEYHLGLFEFPYDKYLVWSDYFKNKLLDISDKYSEENIEVVGHFRLAEKLPVVKRGKNILWLGESNIEYNEITHFIKLIVDNGYNVIFRGKPGTNNNLKKFLKENNISIDNSNSYFECLQNQRIGLVVGTHSTALMESWIVGVPSLALMCSYDYGNHLWEDRLIDLCKEEEDFIDNINRYFDMLDDEIVIIKSKIWNSEIYFNKEKIRKILKV
jgi:hypothetical protein